MASIVRVENTPNPNSRKFVVDQTVASDTQWFGAASEAGPSPVASALFDIEGVANVMLLNDFVTVGKTASASWDTLEGPIKTAIENNL